MSQSFFRLTPFFLVGIIVTVLALATIIDPNGTSSPEVPLIYGTWWFIGLWGILSIMACIWMVKRKLWKCPATLSLHLSFLLILSGAFTTHLTSRKGFIHLRNGEVAHQYMQRSPNDNALLLQGLPFLMALDSFKIKYDKDGITPADYVSYVSFHDHKEKQHTTISMNHIGRECGYRIFQTSYDEDEKGSLFTVTFDPYGTAISYSGYLLLAISMIWSGMRRTKNKDAQSSSTTWFMTILGSLLASYMVFSIAFRPLMPVLRSPLLFIHVGVIMISYVLLVVSMVRREVLRMAVFFLAAGIFLGAIWANISWGSYWSWDPKETWAIITLLVYSIPLHKKSLPWFQDIRHYRLYSIFCLLCLLMTYFGVNYLLGGMHSYAN